MWCLQFVAFDPGRAAAAFDFVLAPASCAFFFWLAPTRYREYGQSVRDFLFDCKAGRRYSLK